MTIVAETVVAMAGLLVLDVAGRCLAARHEDYVMATIGACGPGNCTAFGHAAGLAAFDAALVNGTATIAGLFAASDMGAVAGSRG